MFVFVNKLRAGSWYMISYGNWVLIIVESYYLRSKNKYEYCLIGISVNVPKKNIFKKMHL